MLIRSRISLRNSLYIMGKWKEIKNELLTVPPWPSLFSCIPVIWPGREGGICRICIWLLESLSPYILRIEPQGKKLLCSAYKMKKETKEKLEVFFVSIDENMRPREYNLYYWLFRTQQKLNWELFNSCETCNKIFVKQNCMSFLWRFPLVSISCFMIYIIPH